MAGPEFRKSHQKVIDKEGRNKVMPQAREWPTHAAHCRDEAAAHAKRGLRALEPLLNCPERIPSDLWVPITRAISSLHHVDELMLEAGSTSRSNLNEEPLLYQRSIESDPCDGIPLNYIRIRF